MSVDLIALAVVVAFGVLGARSGLVRQVAYWLALVGATALASPLGKALGPYIGLGSERLNQYAGLLAAWVLLFAVLGLAAFLVQRLARDKDGDVRGSDAWLGAVLGAAKGAVVVLVLATGLILLRQPVAKAFPPVGAAMSSSYTLGVLTRYNPLLTLVRRFTGGERVVTPADRPAEEALKQGSTK